LQVVPVTELVASVAVKTTFTEVPVVAPFVGLLMFTVGPVVSVLNVTDVPALVLPAASVAVTITVCVPSARVGVVNGEVHATAAAASTLQVRLATDVVASVAVNVTVGVAVPSTAFAAGAVIATTGATLSTVKVVDADAVAPMLSVAATMIVWLPLLRLGGVNGEVHEAAAAASTLQVVVTGATPPLVVNVTAGVVVPTNPPLAGALMLTASALATVKFTVAEPVLPAVSVAVTITVCALPAARPA
jgi:hypothetical protein